MPKVVVTGAAGHIGFHVAKALLAKQYELHVLVRSINTNVIALQDAGAVVHACNLLDPATYLPVLRDAGALFHLAAENTTSMQHADRVLENTDTLTRVVLDACAQAGVRTVVYTSSVVVIGRSADPAVLLTDNDRVATGESPYVQGKLNAEIYVEGLVAAGRDIRRVYPSWVVGPDDPKLTPPHKVIKDHLSKGTPVYFGGGVSIAHVEDVANGHVAAYEKGTPGGKYILSGENITFKRFYEILSAHSGKKMPLLQMPKWAIWFASWIFTKLFSLLGKEFPISPAYVESVVDRFSWYDCSRAKNELGYQTRPADEILKGAVKETYRRMAGVALLGKRTNSLPSPDRRDDEGALLITGVPGWLGNRLIDILINGDRFGNGRSGRPVRVMLEPRFRDYLVLPSNFEVVYADLTNKTQLQEAVKGVQTVFHLAGAIYPKQIDVLYKVNEQGAKNLVDACIDQGVRRIVYMSTDSTCGHGTKAKPVFDEHTGATPYKNYGKSKYAGEKYILDKTKAGQIDGTSLRGFWFFGPFAPDRQLNFVNMFYWPRQIVFGNGKNLRSISHTDNIIEAFFAVEKNQATYGQWYWIGNDRPHPTVDDIYKAIANELGVPYKPLYIPKLFCRGFETLDSMLGKCNYLHPTIHAAGKFDYDIAGDIDKAKRDFGYVPRVSLQDAAKELKQMTS